MRLSDADVRKMRLSYADVRKMRLSDADVRKMRLSDAYCPTYVLILINSEYSLLINIRT